MKYHSNEGRPSEQLVATTSNVTRRKADNVTDSSK